MPPKSKANKACSLCHQICEELKYHYDICEPCHQNEAEVDPFQGLENEEEYNGQDTDQQEYTDSERWESDYDSDDDVLSEEENDEEVIENELKRQNANTQQDDDSEKI